MENQSLMTNKSKPVLREVVNGVDIYEHERIDELQRNGYRIIQDPDRFCFGMDAVLLSGFAAEGATGIKAGSKVIDLGTGTGIIPILLEAKTEAHGCHWRAIWSTFLFSLLSTCFLYLNCCW